MQIVLFFQKTLPISQHGLSMLEKYVLVCLFFIAAALIEYLIIMVPLRITEENKTTEIAKDLIEGFLSKQRQKRLKGDPEALAEARRALKNASGDKECGDKESKKNVVPFYKKMYQAEGKIDLLSMIAYFVVYTIFNIWYSVKAYELYAIQIACMEDCHDHNHE